MLKIKNLKFNNIGRFVEEQAVDFSLLGDLNQVDGQNNNTGGSSGSGKSTVFNALDYLLGLNDVSSTILQSRLTKEPIYVSAEFDLDGKPLLITRSKKGLKIDLDGEITEGSSKLAEEKLDQILGVSRELFRKMLHKRQKEGGFFLDLTPKETHKFLTDGLGLTYLSDKVTIIENDLKELIQQKESIQSNINNTSSILLGVKDTISSLAKPQEPSVDDSILIELKKKKDDAIIGYEETLKRHKEQESALLAKRPETSVLPFDTSRLKSLENQKREIEEKIRSIQTARQEQRDAISNKIASLNTDKIKLHSTIADGDRAKQEIERIVAEVKKIRSSQCPTCDQHWATDSAKNKELELINKINSLKTIVLNASEALNKYDLLEKEINTTRESIPSEDTSKETEPLRMDLLNLTNEIKEENKKASEFIGLQNTANQNILSEFYSKQSALKEYQSKELSMKAETLHIHRDTFDKANNELLNYRSNMDRFMATSANLEKNKTTYETQIVNLSSALREIEKKIVVVEEVKKAIKTYTSCSFDDALAVIGEDATRIIRSIPNMANATITLEGIKETKDGRIKEEVTAVIGTDGELEIPIKSLSGGERSSVDLAVDLAVINMLESKSNKGIDTFILDEPFTGLDTISVEMTLEILKNSNLNKKLIIVDHNPIINQMVENKIMVVRSGIESKVVQ